MTKRSLRIGGPAGVLLAAVAVSGTAWAGPAAPQDAAALAHAIALAEQDGGRVLELRYQETGQLPAYEAWVVKGSLVEHRSIDPRSWAVTTNGTAVPVAKLDMRERKAAKNLRHALVSIADAMMTAHKATDQPVTAAEFITSPSASILAYQIEMRGNMGTDRLLIDAKSGNVISTPDLVTSG